MLSPIGVLGRFGFLWRTAVLNVIGVTLGLGVLVVHPGAGTSAAFLVLLGGLFWAWFSTHARRRNDAGLSRGWAAMMAGLLFCGYALGYIVLAALWAVPEPQRDAFVTGGVMTSRPEALDGALWQLGGLFYSALGTAGALAISGLIVTLFALMVIFAGVFSLATLLASPRRAPATSTPAALQQMTRPAPRSSLVGADALMETARRLGAKAAEKRP